MLKFLFMLTILFTFILLIFLFLSANAEPLSPEEIIKKRCVACHNLSVVFQAKKNKDEWGTTIDRMIRYGLHLSKEEKEEVIEYLKDLK